MTNAAEVSGVSTQGRLTGLAIASVTASLWSTIIGLALPGIVVVVAWMFTPHDAAAGGTALGGAMRFAALIWVAGHGVPLVSEGMSISLLPWLLMLWPAFVVARAARRVADVLDVDTLRDALAVAVAVGLTHAGWTVAVAAAAGTPGLTVRPGQALLHAAVLACTSAAAALLSRVDLRGDLADRLPSPVRLGLRLGVLSALAVMGAATIAVVASIIVRWGDVAAVSSALASDLPAHIGLAVLSVLFLGTAIGWVSAWLVGSPVMLAGEPVGPWVGGMGTPGELDPMPALPALPTLALLPERMPAWVGFLPVIWLAVLVTAAVALLRRTPTWTWAHRSGAGAVVVVTAATILTALAALSSGAWGNAALVQVGPEALIVARDAALTGSLVLIVILGTPPMVRSVVASLRARRRAGEV